MKTILVALVMGLCLHATADTGIEGPADWSHPQRSGLDLSPLEKCVGGDESRRTQCLDKMGFGVSYLKDRREQQEEQDLKQRIQKCASDTGSYSECSRKIKANSTAQNSRVDSDPKLKNAVKECVKNGTSRAECIEMLTRNSTADAGPVSDTPQQSASLSTNVVH